MTTRNLTIGISALCLCLPLPAQNASSSGFNRPPAGVDEALRERVSAFYSFEQQGKFRQAEALVCEASKDRYYNQEKQRWTSVEIVQLTYEDGFHSAKATMALGSHMNTLSGPLPVKAPLTSLWRFESGSWCRHLPEPGKEGVPSPFGTMHKTGGTAAQAAPGAAPAVPVVQSVGQLLAMVKFSKTSLRLPARQGGEDSIEILNGMPGTVQLRVRPVTVPGLSVDLSAKSLAKGEKAVLRAVYTPQTAQPQAPVSIRIVLEPFGSVRVIRAAFE